MGRSSAYRVLDSLHISGLLYSTAACCRSYFHYLHHRYFECNYGEASIPLDKWFGSFRDGKSQKPKDREPTWVTATTVAVGISIGVAPLVPFIMGVM